MKKNKPEKKKGSKKKLLLIAATVVIIGAAAFSGNSGNKSNTGSGSAETETVKTPEYENVSNDEYVRDGKQCVSYRVSVSSDLTDDELTAVFNDVCNCDDYYLHTVWFYSSSELASGGNSYDVAMLEETVAGSDPVITRK